jgi:protein-S-isoprenylcysteine O-methyltransferase Ste14
VKGFGGIGLPEWLWLSFLLYWVLSARSVATTKVEEGLAVRIASNSLLLLAAMLLVGSAIPLGPLDGRFVPALAWISTAGVALTAAGLAFAVWARVHLGRNWSGRVTLKVGHQLIRTGPYALIRHPIYSGILAGLLGTALWIGEYRALLGVGLWWKAHREEVFLAREFGEEYARYRQRAGMFVPRFHHH